MIEAHLRKLRRRDRISAAEEQALRDCVGSTRTVRAKETVIRSGDELNESTLLLVGWLARTKDLRGGERQLLELHVAGDFADLHSLTLKRLDHDVVAITPCTLAMAPHERLRAVTAEHPHLARVLWLMTNIDASVQREWTFSLGRRSAIARMAHLFCELFIRLEIVGLTRDMSFDFPLTQAELSECLGITPVHANRMLQELRQKNLITLTDRAVTILDWPGLQDIAEFDAAYLHLEELPR
jgi:CRP-like cAMP-binding protein